MDGFVYFLEQILLL